MIQFVHQLLFFIKQRKDSIVCSIRRTKRAEKIKEAQFGAPERTFTGCDDFNVAYKTYALLVEVPL
ncbi:hypothetical protein P343_01435 [Sporolactobacillus laevolacticus DSM 442]|uniref:Uncharacterized protein n=1 Tax=Sporolactobacillus laevolacticus DSM 442 TaxID=1395513 RepID=V6J1C9_9BACL|nr:hypothetical protein P343_01435 [Sporolactobacillus laevolacticus DSM 442]